MFENKSEEHQPVSTIDLRNLPLQQQRGGVFDVDTLRSLQDLQRSQKTQHQVAMSFRLAELRRLR